MAKLKTQLSHLAKYNLRLHPDLKAKLERMAKKAARSLNAEITDRLEQSFEQRQDLRDYSDGDLLDELIRRWGRDRLFIRFGDE